MPADLSVSIGPVAEAAAECRQQLRMGAAVFELQTQQGTPVR